MEKRDRFTAGMDKRANVKKMALLEQVRSGEKTLEEVQKELAKIKRNAKKSGQITKNQAFFRG